MIEYVELRLYTDATATAFNLLPNFAQVSFDVKYNDLGAMNFTYPLVEATTLGLADQDIIGVVLGFTNGTSREIDRYVVDSTSDDKVEDGVRMKTVNATSSLKMLADALVYPSNWIRTQITSWNRTGGNLVELVIGAHTYGIGSKVFLSGLSDPTVNGEQTVSAITGTSIKFVNTGSNFGATVPTDAWVTQAAPSGHQFNDSTIGTIFRTLIDRAQARGGLINIVETGFSGTLDSNAVAWNYLHTQNYGTGTDYYAILSEFMQRGVADAWLSGWNLNIINGGTRGNHIAIGTVELRPAKNVTEMTTSTQSSDSASTVLIEGDEGTALERHNPSVQTLLGRRRERFVSQGGIKDAGVLTLLADAELTQYGRIPTEETIGVSSGSLTPFFDFDIADWVWVRYDTDQAPVERRVRQLGVSVDQNRNISLGLTLNTILYEADVAAQRKIDALTGNGGTYGGTPNSIPDTTTPKPPSGLGVTSGTYIDGAGQYRAAFVANWTAPTQNVDGSTVTDLDHYEIQYQYSSGAGQPADQEWKTVFRTSGSETTFGYSPVQPGVNMLVRVRAVDNTGTRSDWLTLGANHLIAKDTTPPPVPSQPSHVNQIGHVDITWDGKDNTATAITVNDFDHIEIWMSPSTPGFTPGVGDAVLVGTMTAKGTLSVKGGLENTDCYYKFVSVDKAGNASVASVSETAKVLYSVVTDPGVAPVVAPVPTLIGGVGSLHIHWDPLVSNYALTYEVHVSTTSGFTPDLTTLAAETDATVANIRFLRKNLLLNGNFENVANTFTPSVGTLAQYDSQQAGAVVTDPVSGRYVGVWDPGTTGAQYLEYNDNVVCGPGDKVRIAGRMRTPSNTKNFTVSMRWFNASNALISTSTSTVTVSPVTGWGVVSETMQAPALTAYGRFRTNVTATSVGEKCYVDLLEAVADDLTQPLEYDTRYYVKVLAKTSNIFVGPASTEISDTLYKVGNTEIGAQYIYGGTITAEQITTGDLTATVQITTGQLNIGNSVFDATGLDLIQPNSGRILLPTDGIRNAEFKRVSATFTDAVFEGNVKILGTQNYLAGDIKMEASVSNPGTAPSINISPYQSPPSYAYTDLTGNSSWPNAGNDSPYVGMFEDGANWLTMKLNAGKAEVGQIVKSTRVYSTLKADVYNPATDGDTALTDVCGAVKIGTSYYAMIEVKDNLGNPSFRVNKYSDITFTTRQATYLAQYNAATYASYNVSGFKFAPNSGIARLFSDGTNIYITVPYYVYINPYYNPTDHFVRLTSTLTTPTRLGGGTGAQWVGAGDYGAVYILGGGGGSTLYPILLSTMVSDATRNFTVPMYPNTAGRLIAYDSTASKFHAFAYDYYSTYKWYDLVLPSQPVSLANPKFAYTLYDSDGTGGNHETLISPIYTIPSLPARSFIRASVTLGYDGGGTDDPDSARLYARTDGSATLKLQFAGATFGVGVSTKAFDASQLINTGTDVPSSNSFTSVSNPGVLFSETTDGTNPWINLKGSGVFRLGGISFDPSSDTYKNNMSSNFILKNDAKGKYPWGGTGAPSWIGSEVLDVTLGQYPYSVIYGSGSWQLGPLKHSYNSGIVSTDGADLTVDGALTVFDPSTFFANVEFWGDLVSASGGTLNLNPGLPVSLSKNNKTLSVIGWGTATLPNSGAVTSAVTFNHNLGQSPVAVVSIPIGGTGVTQIFCSNGWNSTQISITGRRYNDTNFVNTNTVCWFAIG